MGAHGRLVEPLTHWVIRGVQSVTLRLILSIATTYDLDG